MQQSAFRTSWTMASMVFQLYVYCALSIHSWVLVLLVWDRRPVFYCGKDPFIGGRRWSSGMLCTGTLSAKVHGVRSTVYNWLSSGQRWVIEEEAKGWPSSASSDIILQSTVPVTTSGTPSIPVFLPLRYWYRYQVLRVQVYWTCQGRDRFTGAQTTGSVYCLSVCQAKSRQPPTIIVITLWTYTHNWPARTAWPKKLNW